MQVASAPSLLSGICVVLVIVAWQQVAAQHCNACKDSGEGDDQGHGHKRSNYEEINKRYFIEGDMAFPIEMREERRKRILGVNKRSSMSVAHYGVWPGGIVPYLVDRTLIKYKDVIAESLKAMSDATGGCVQFVALDKPPADITKKPYVIVESGKGCVSGVGYHVKSDNTSKPAWVSLQAERCTHKTAIQHEFMHTLGFEHEMNRPDRDDTITVNYPGFAFQQECDKFVKCLGCETDGLPYDVTSIVQYASSPLGNPACAKNGIKYDMTTKDGQPIKQPPEISKTDVQRIHKRYKCKKQGNKFVSQVSKDLGTDTYSRCEVNGTLIFEVEQKYRNETGYIIGQTPRDQKYVDGLVKKLDKEYNSPGCKWTLVFAGPQINPDLEPHQEFRFSFDNVNAKPFGRMSSKSYYLYVHHPAPPEGDTSGEEKEMQRKIVKMENKAKDKAWCDSQVARFQTDMMKNNGKRYKATPTEAVYHQNAELNQESQEGAHEVSKARGLIRSSVFVAMPKGRKYYIGTSGKVRINYKATCFPEVEAFWID